MNCPYCTGEMKTHSIAGRLGKKITIRKCGHCDGFWLKNFDLFDMSENDCQQLDDSIFAHNDYSKPIICPYCDKKMTDYRHYNLPRDLHFKRCSECGGIWSYPGKIIEFKRRQHEGLEKASRIPSRTRLLLTISFSFIFAIFSYVNLANLTGGAIFSAYDGSTNGAEGANLHLAIQGVILLLFLGTILVLWGKYRKAGWILNFTSLFVIIFYVMMRIVNYYPFISKL